MDSGDYFRKVHSLPQSSIIDNQYLGFAISNVAPIYPPFLPPARIPQGNLYSPRQMLALAQFYDILPHEFARRTTLNHETKYSGG